MPLVDIFGNPIASPKPASSGYKSGPMHVWGTQPRDLPLFTFQMVRYMLIDPTIRLGLAMRAAPICSAEVAYKEGQQWIPGVKADKPEVAAFVERQIARIWKYDIKKILSAQIWGWSSGEVMYKADPQTGLIEFDEILERHARDCLAIMRGDRIVGVRVSQARNTDAGTNEVDLQIPGKSFWHSFDNEGENPYGRSILYGAYSPFADKWFDGGALDVRRLYMHTDAYAGRRIGYPSGTTTLDSGQVVPNVDIARQMAEQYKSGDVMTYPTQYDGNGRPMWVVDDAKQTVGNAAHILQFPQDLDVEMLRGMEIADDVLTSEATGAWQGKQIPMIAFMTGLNMWGNQVLGIIVKSICEPLVLWNWGKAEDFEACLKPIEVQAMEAQQGPQEQQPMMPGAMPGSEGGAAGGFGGGFMPQDPGAPFMGMSLVQQIARGEMTARQAVQDAVLRQSSGRDSRITQGNGTPQSSPRIRLSTKSDKEGYDYGTLMLRLPTRLANQVEAIGSKIKPEDLHAKGAEDDPHITVVYGIETDDPKVVKHAMRRQGPITARMGKLSLFENDDYDVLKIEVESDDLHRAHNAVFEGCPAKKLYPEYSPHVTVAYLKPGAGDAYVEENHPLEGSECAFNDAVFSDTHAFKTDIPLSGKKRMSYGSGSPWSEHQGSRGGRGWKNAETGEIRYQQDRPGAGSVSMPKEMDPQPEGVKKAILEAREKLGDELAGKIARRERGQGGVAKISRDELEKILSVGVVGFVSAGRNPADPQDVELTDEQVNARYDNLRSDLKQLGFMYVPVEGHCGEREDSFLIMAPESSKRELMALGKKYNQDSVVYSVANDNELIYTTGKNKGKSHPGVGFMELPDADDYFSVFEAPSGERIKFALNLNFEHLRRSVLSLVRMGKWVEYTGPLGGLGWKHPGTGEVRYQKNPPADGGGRANTRQASSQSNRKANVANDECQGIIRRVVGVIKAVEGMNDAPGVATAVVRGLPRQAHTLLAALQLADIAGDDLPPAALLSEQSFVEWSEWLIRGLSDAGRIDHDDGADPSNYLDSLAERIEEKVACEIPLPGDNESRTKVMSTPPGKKWITIGAVDDPEDEDGTKGGRPVLIDADTGEIEGGAIPKETHGTNVSDLGDTLDDLDDEKDGDSKGETDDDSDGDEPEDKGPFRIKPLPGEEKPSWWGRKISELTDEENEARRKYNREESAKLRAEREKERNEMLDRVRSKYGKRVPRGIKLTRDEFVAAKVFQAMEKIRPDLERINEISDMPWGDRNRLSQKDKDLIAKWAPDVPDNAYRANSNVMSEYSALKGYFEGGYFDRSPTIWDYEKNDYVTPKGMDFVEQYDTAMKRAMENKEEIEPEKLEPYRYNAGFPERYRRFLSADYEVKRFAETRDSEEMQHAIKQFDEHFGDKLKEMDSVRSDFIENHALPGPETEYGKLRAERESINKKIDGLWNQYYDIDGKIDKFRQENNLDWGEDNEHVASLLEERMALSNKIDELGDKSWNMAGDINNALASYNRESVASMFGNNSKVNVRGGTGHLTDEGRERVNDAADFLSKILPRDFDMKIKPLPEGQYRAFARGDTMYTLPTPNTATIIHEVGHNIEHGDDDRVGAISKAFQYKHLQGLDASYLGDDIYNENDPYRPHEVGHKDGFLRAYTGKYYGGKGSTEILSMGLQHLYEDPVHFAKEAPDHFNYTIAYLKGLV